MDGYEQVNVLKFKLDKTKPYCMLCGNLSSYNIKMEYVYIICEDWLFVLG
jgi:hypothetical protein